MVLPGTVMRLEDVNLSNRVLQSWIAYIPMAVQDLMDLYPDLDIDEVSEPAFRELETGAGEIYAYARDRRIVMKVPYEEWGNK